MPVASQSDVGYCSPELKKILRRVLMSCGLVGGNAARGCQPVQAKNVATMSGPDFNALFKPMHDRGGIVEFQKDKADLDPQGLQLVDQVFADQKGASWFFVVARASPEGAIEHNRELSKARAESVMDHLHAQFKDPDLDKEVGMLWLGAEFAQLVTEFCQWKREWRQLVRRRGNQPERIRRMDRLSTLVGLCEFAAGCGRRGTGASARTAGLLSQPPISWLGAYSKYVLSPPLPGVRA